MPEVGLVGEVEAWPVGRSCHGNIAETEPDATVEGHDAEGMATGFTV